VPPLFLIVGLPGAGKTTRARQLAADHPALRLTPDEWMIPLFGEPAGDRQRDLLEGRLIWVALETLKLGTSVVLDLGFWSRDERSSLRWLAGSAGATGQVVYLPVDRPAQLERIRRRWAATPEQTYPVTEADLDSWRSLFEPPDQAELTGADIPAPPPPWPSWPAWAANRWPSLPDPGAQLSG
jgi:predicted kinase